MSLVLAMATSACSDPPGELPLLQEDAIIQKLRTEHTGRCIWFGNGPIGNGYTISRFAPQNTLHLNGKVAFVGLETEKTEAILINDRGITRIPPEEFGKETGTSVLFSRDYIFILHSDDPTRKSYYYRGNTNPPQPCSIENS